MCRIEAIEVCQTHNHVIIKTDTRGDIFIHGEDLGIDFTTLTPDYGAALVIRYIKRKKAEKQKMREDNQFYKQMNRTMSKLFM